MLSSSMSRWVADFKIDVLFAAVVRAAKSKNIRRQILKTSLETVLEESKESTDSHN
jgi:hypothetical protein